MANQYVVALSRTSEGEPEFFVVSRRTKITKVSAIGDKRPRIYSRLRRAIEAAELAKIFSYETWYISVWTYDAGPRKKVWPEKREPQSSEDRIAQFKTDLARLFPDWNQD